MPEVHWYHWIAFGVAVTVLLVLDLTVFHRKSHRPSLRESALWTVFWSALALAFNVLVYFWLGKPPAMAFLQGYVVEWSLSMDNVFVFAIVFSFFRVELEHQYRVLFWGILGAIVMRLAFVAGATGVIHHFDWMLWIFGAFLLYTGIKLAMHSGQEVHPEKNLLIRLSRRIIPVAEGQHGQKFFVRIGGKLHATPLLLVLLVIESTDVVFAVDSVPAIVGVVKMWMQPGSTFTFIAFTSNVFAIMGLRSLYFLLAGAMDLFRYLHYGLAAVLVFVGGKMVGDYWVPRIIEVEHPDHFHLVTGWQSMAIIFSLLALAVVASLLARWREQRARPDGDPPGGER